MHVYVSLWTEVVLKAAWTQCAQDRTGPAQQMSRHITPALPGQTHVDNTSSEIVKDKDV